MGVRPSPPPLAGREHVQVNAARSYRVERGSNPWRPTVAARAGCTARSSKPGFARFDSGVPHVRLRQRFACGPDLPLAQRTELPPPTRRVRVRLLGGRRYAVGARWPGSVLLMRTAEVRFLPAAPRGGACWVHTGLMIRPTRVRFPPPPRPDSSVGRAPVRHTGGRRFESASGYAWRGGRRGKSRLPFKQDTLRVRGPSALLGPVSFNGRTAGC